MKTDQEIRNIFVELLTSDLPEKEKTEERLADEALAILGGGTETTAWSKWDIFIIILCLTSDTGLAHADLDYPFHGQYLVDLTRFRGGPLILASTSHY
jgi:hypothetical protein